ncbi:MAG: hypothetical protein OER21_10770 [Gemmatimonadota bacterium]|nr:hypothetical protein [Gemmatimonadota bacterium]
MGGPGLPFLLPRQRLRPSYLGPQGGVEDDPLLRGLVPGVESPFASPNLRQAAFSPVDPSRSGPLDAADVPDLRAAIDQLDEPIVPFTRRGRPMTLQEIGSAGVVDQRRPTFLSRLGEGLMAAAQANLFDPNAENEVEAFLGAGLRTFGAVQAGRAGRELGTAREEERIVTGERQRRAAAVDEALSTEERLGRIRAYDALAQERLAGALRDLAFAESGGTAARPTIARDDLEPIAAEWESQGRPDMAAVVRNPENASFLARNPSFLKPPREPTTRTPQERIPEVDRQAIERADQADRSAGTHILQLRREPMTAPPAARIPDILTEVRYLVDPTYQADSTVRAKYRGPAQPVPGLTPAGAAAPAVPPELEILLGAPGEAEDPLVAAVRSYQRAAGGAPTPGERTRTTGGRLAPGPAQPSSPRPGRAVAESRTKEMATITPLLGPDKLPVDAAVTALRQTTPPFEWEEIRRMLLDANYEKSLVESVIPKEQRGGATRPTR